MKNIIRSILICFSVVLLMSHNVSALEFGNSGVYGINAANSYINFPQISGMQSQRFYAVGYGAEIIPDTTYAQRRLGAIRIRTNAAIPAHTIFNLSGLVCGSGVNTSYNGFVGAGGFSIISQNSTATDGDCINFSVTGVTGNNAVQNLDFGFNDDSGSYFWFFGTGAKLAVQPISWLTLSSETDYSGGIQSIISGLDTLRLQNNDIYTMLTNLNNSQTITNNRLDTLRIQNNDIYNGIVNIRNDLNSLGVKLDNLPQNTADAVTETEQEKVQESADDAQAGADNAQADSEQATSSLLDTVTGVFNAIINANATNCKFDSHLPFMSGNGEIDLCAIPAPPIVQGIGSLIALGLFAPFALHMFRRFVSITESFQR